MFEIEAAHVAQVFVLAACAKPAKIRAEKGESRNTREKKSEQ
jgi:hypothetical protein